MSQWVWMRICCVISSFYLHPELGVQHTHRQNMMFSVDRTHNAYKIYRLRCFKRFLHWVFVCIVWCRITVSVSCGFVGYIFCVHSFRIRLVYFTSTLFNECVWSLASFLLSFSNIIQPLNSKRDFHIFIYFQNIFVHESVSLFWFPIECSSLMSFCPANIRAIHGIRGHTWRLHVFKS